MATIERTVHVGDKPTAEALAEVKRAEKMPITYDEDSPKLTENDYARLAAAARVRRK